MDQWNSETLQNLTNRAWGEGGEGGEKGGGQNKSGGLNACAKTFAHTKCTFFIFCNCALQSSEICQV